MSSRVTHLWQECEVVVLPGRNLVAHESFVSLAIDDYLAYGRGADNELRENGRMLALTSI